MIARPGSGYGGSVRRMATLIFSGSLTSMAVAALITGTSILGSQQNNFERQTVAHRAEEIAKILIASPSDEADSILAEAAEPDLTFKLERPSAERRRYLQRTIAQYIRPGVAKKLEDDPEAPPDLAGEEYRPRDTGLPLRIARDAMGLSSRHLAYVQEGTGRDFWRISIPVKDGLWLSVEARPTQSVPQGLPRLVVIFIAVAVIIAIGSIIALRRLTDPLHALESAAIQLGRDLDAPPLKEEGPADIRRVAHAFNRMQAQLRRFVGDRTTMLAAISHDLRTPLQRLKFRADFMTDDEQREKMLRDLRDMESMIAATLDFARADADSEAATWHDLVAMLAGIAGDLKESGYDVMLAGTPAVTRYWCRGRALRRAIENLALNAATHGAVARLSIERQPDQIVVTVEDDGPGLPPDRIEDMFAPFHRMDPARTGNSGTGLGLSIARSIARSHGGDITLANRIEGGLTARLTLPA